MGTWQVEHFASVKWSRVACAWQSKQRPETVRTTAMRAVSARVWQVEQSTSPVRMCAGCENLRLVCFGVGPRQSTYVDVDRESGWMTFAGIVIMMVAILNIIDGIAAISASSFFVSDARYVFSDLNTWGWIMLGLGVLQVVVCLGLWAGNQLARWAGIVIVSLNAIAQLLFIPAYPFWSLSIFALDVLVLYGLAAHGGRPALD